MYNRHLCNLIAAGKAKPSFIVSHELPLAQAPERYRHFNDRDEGWTKIVLKPWQAERDGTKVSGEESVHQAG